MFLKAIHEEIDLVEETKEIKDTKLVKPMWNMAVMFLSRINDILKYLNSTAIEVRRGNIQMIPEYYAVLGEFSNNISYFMSYERIKMVDSLLTEAGNKINVITRQIPKHPNTLLRLINILNLSSKIMMTSLFESELFMKFMEQASAETRMRRYLIPKKAGASS